MSTRQIIKGLVVLATIILLIMFAAWLISPALIPDL